MHKSGRISELDGLRGIAVLMVIMWHYTGSLINEPLWAAKLVQSITIFGRTGVDLFFVLSGFLIVGILIDNRGAPNVFHVFYWRRVLRIFPPYFLLVAVYWICYAATGESASFNTNAGLATQLVAQLTFTWNWLMAIVDGPLARGFAVTWSVGIEEWFYLIAPWIIIAVPMKRLPVLLIAVGLASIVARALAFLWIGQEYSLAPYILPPFRLDGLCVGGLIAYALRTPTWRVAMEGQKSKIACISIVFAATIPIIIGVIRPALDLNMHLWGHTYLSLGYGITLLSVVLNLGNDRLSFLRRSFLKQAGRYSYTLYLFHPLFLSLFFVVTGRPELIHSWGDALTAALALVISILWSILVYHFVEGPCQRIGHRVVYGSKLRTEAFP